MKKNIKLAKELVKIAKSLVAADYDFKNETRAECNKYISRVKSAMTRISQKIKVTSYFDTDWAGYVINCEGIGESSLRLCPYGDNYSEPRYRGKWEILSEYSDGSARSALFNSFTEAFNFAVRIAPRDLLEEN